MGKDINAPNWVKAFFNSFSQVVLVENIISGALILASFFVFSWEVENWNIGIITVIATILGNLTAKLLGNDEDAIASGLYGFCPVLVGLGAATFFSGPEAYIVGIVGGILSIPMTTIINNLCARFELPGFTFPFIATTWFLILVSYQTGLLNAVGREGSLVATRAITNGPLEWKNVLTKGIGEIYLLDSVVASLMIFVAFAVDRWHLAIKIAIVILVNIALGVIFKVDTDTLNMGLYTYNSILLLMGMETFSTSKDNPVKYWGLILFGLVLVAFVDYGLPSVLMPFGLPSLTFPFVLATWALLYFEKHLSLE